MFGFFILIFLPQISQITQILTVMILENIFNHVAKKTYLMHAWEPYIFQN